MSHADHPFYCLSQLNCNAMECIIWMHWSLRGVSCSLQTSDLEVQGARRRSLCGCQTDSVPRTSWAGGPVQTAGSGPWACQDAVCSSKSKALSTPSTFYIANKLTGQHLGLGEARVCFAQDFTPRGVQSQGTSLLLLLPRRLLV